MRVWQIYFKQCRVTILCQMNSLACFIDAPFDSFITIFDFAKLRRAIDDLIDDAIIILTSTSHWHNRWRAIVTIHHIFRSLGLVSRFQGNRSVMTWLLITLYQWALMNCGKLLWNRRQALSSWHHRRCHNCRLSHYRMPNTHHKPSTRAIELAFALR